MHRHALGVLGAPVEPSRAETSWVPEAAVEGFDWAGLVGAVVGAAFALLAWSTHRRHRGSGHDPITHVNEPIFKLRQRVIVTSEMAGVLDGEYRVADVSGSQAILEPVGWDGRSASLVLRPRHEWLVDDRGSAIDVWTFCNVFVDGRHEWIGRVTAHSNDAVHLELGD